MCSASMNINAMITVVNTSATGNRGVKPICRYTKTQNAPVNSSTAGYRIEIGSLQLRHFPPRMSQLKIGMLSCSLIAESHLGQVEFVNTMDCICGTRWITTLRKLPTAAPKTNVKITATISGKPVISSNEEKSRAIRQGSKREWKLNRA